MELNAAQIRVLTKKITNEIQEFIKNSNKITENNCKNSEEFQNLLREYKALQEEYKEICKLRDSFGKKVEKFLNSYGIKTSPYFASYLNLTKQTLLNLYCSSKDTHFDQRVDKDDIKEEIILATIDQTDVESIINSIKEKHCGN